MQLITTYSNRMRIMAVICSFLVVAIHVPVRFSPGTTNWFVHFIFVDVIARMAVPFFFFASGFFMAKNLNVKFTSLIAKKMKTLFVPYAFFMLVGAAHYVLTAQIFNHVSPGLIQLPSLSAQTFLDWSGINLMAFPIYGVLWYVRTLMVFALLAPAIFSVMRYRYFGAVLIGIIALLSVTIEFTCQNSQVRAVNGYYFTPFGPWWYFVGLYWSLHGKPYKVNAKIVSVAFLFFLCCALIFAICGKEKFSHLSVECFIPCGLWVLWKLSKNMNRILNWSIVPIMVYLLHFLFVAMFKNLCAAFHMGKVIQSSLLMFFVSWFGAFLVTVAMSGWLVKHMPVFSQIIFGGRLKIKQAKLK